MSIKVYFDFICPFCYLGRNFWLKMQQEHPVVAEWVPWEIHPEFPPEGKANVVTENYLKRLRTLAEDTCSFELTTHTPNSHNALMGLEFARAAGKLDAYVERFFKACFVENIDFSSVDVVVHLGTEVGLDGDALRKSIQSKQYENILAKLDEEAEGLGLEVVPSFVQDGKLVLAGSTTMKFGEFRDKYLSVWG